MIFIDENIKLGKTLSYLLRHNPESIGIKLDEKGYADVSELLEAMKKSRYKINMKILENIVDTNDKKRYSFNEDKTKIRANQGHSIDVDVELKEIIPPDTLYHGTASRFINSIKKLGLLKQNRNYVHLSLDEKTAFKVGSRHGKPVVLIIDSKAMHNDGCKFYLSENGVYLTDNVPVKYIEFGDYMEII
ncbi:MAG: RNA 2'-phosphotransferase [Oscillospiraceae bacterium]|nr:RNA 2'-phosphotransferase [Oscillospiraceae bacterium]